MPLKLNSGKPKTGLKIGGLKPAKSPGGTGGGPVARAKPGSTWDKAEQAQKEQDRKRAMPWRASIPKGSEGIEVYFLDRGEPFSMYEHSLGGSKTRAGKQFPCIKDTNEACPACQKDPKGDGYFIMLLSAVIPKLTVVNKDDETKVYHFQKKEWPVKIKMVKKYQRLFNAHGTFRGMVCKVSRDGQLDPATGNDIEFVRMMTEKEIAKYAANPKYAELKLAEPYDFEKIHKKPTAAELSKLIGGVEATSGSADFDDSEDFDDAAGGWGEG